MVFSIGGIYLMDCAKVGQLICQLRKERGLTQKVIATALNISDKTISKWERGYGCPDISLLTGLSGVLGADILKLLEGDLDPNRKDSGNIRLTRFYVCPACGNILTSTGKASIFCCGRKLEPLIPMRQSPSHQMEVSVVDIEYYVTVRHEMRKDHYISFIAYVGADQFLVKRLYPEQDASVRIPLMQPGGKFYAYCTRDGLWAQPLPYSG
jgi:Predicted transcriptional regulators